MVKAINQAEVFRYLTKPWDEKQLREHIRQAFKYHATMQPQD